MLYVLPSTIAGASNTLPSLIIPIITSNFAPTELRAVASVWNPLLMYCGYKVWNVVPGLKFCSTTSTSALTNVIPASVSVFCVVIAAVALALA